MKNTIGSYIKMSLLILLGISLIWVLYLARAMLWPFALALLLVYLLTPLVDYLTDKKLPRVAATFCAYTVLFSIFTLIMLVVIPSLVDAFQEIYSELPQYIDATKEYAASLQEKYRGLGLLLEREELTDWLFQGIGALTGKVAQSIAMVPAGIFLFILSLIISFYLLKDARKIRSALMNYIPKEYQKKVSGFLTDVDEILRLCSGDRSRSVQCGTLLWCCDIHNSCSIAWLYKRPLLRLDLSVGNPTLHRSKSGRNVLSGSAHLV
jgi:predicted PurR-regulated permease PerM